MSKLSLRLPESLRKQVKALAKEEGVSVNPFVKAALAEKLSALLTQEYLGARAARGDRGAFERVLARIPDAEPEAGDGL